MIETYGVDLAPVEAGEEYQMIVTSLIGPYRKNLEGYRSSQRKVAMVGEALDRFAAAVTNHTLATKAVLSLLAGKDDPVPVVTVFKSDLGVNTPPEKMQRIFDSVLKWYSDGAKLMKDFKVAVEGVLEASSKCRENADWKVASYELIIQFWEMSLELRKLEHVFEHADMKYKKKVCKECVKLAKEVVAGGEIALKGIDGDSSEELRVAMKGHIERQIVFAQNRRKVFAELKGYIETNGIEAAFKKWQEASRRIIS